MRDQMIQELADARITIGPMASSNEYGFNGAFVIKRDRIEYVIICSDQLGWEHVSVQITKERRVPRRCPTWDEMCMIKDLFWSSDEIVIQYHPAEKDYVNVHPYVLHLWKPVGALLPTPPIEMIGTVSA